MYVCEYTVQHKTLQQHCNLAYCNAMFQNNCKMIDTQYDFLTMLQKCFKHIVKVNCIKNLSVNICVCTFSDLSS